MILVGGPVTPDAVGAMTLRDKVVLYVHDYSTTIPMNATQVARALRVSGARAIIAISNLDSAAFSARVPKYGPERYGIEVRTGSPPSLEVSESVVMPVLQAAGVSLADVRRAARPVSRDLPGSTATVEMKETVIDSLDAPNTIGILEGSDPVLRNDSALLRPHGPRGDHTWAAGQHQQRCRRQRFRHHRRDRAGRGVQPPGRAPQAGPRSSS